MTTTYLSISEFPGDGVTTEWEFNFAGGYISREHVLAYVRTETGAIVPYDTGSAFVSDFKLSVVPPVPVGHTLRIYRNTPRDEPIVNFTRGSNFTEGNLDLLARQTIFAVAEAFDAGAYAAVNDLLGAAGAALTGALDAQAGALAAASAAATALADAEAAQGAAEAAQGAAEAAAEAAVGDFTLPAAGAVSRAVTDRLKDTVSVKDFGAVGDGVANDTTSFQACLDYANSIGAVAYIPAGDYLITSTLTVSNATDTELRDNKASIRGDGPTASRIIAGAGAFSVIRFVNGTTSAGTHSHQHIEGLSIVKSGSDGSGIHVSNAAFFAMRDVLISGAGIGLLCDDVLSSNFTDCRFLFNKNGINFSRQAVSDGFQSAPNAITLVTCVIGNNSETGATFTQGGCINFVGGSVEGNGITGVSASRYGVQLADLGLESGVGANFVGTYFEANAGTADLWIANSVSSAAYTLTGVTFNRALATGGATNNIRIETSNGHISSVRLSGCGFKHFGGYAPSAANPTIAQFGSAGGVNRVSWDSCSFSSTLDRPIMRNYSSNITAYGSVTAAGSLIGESMNVASVVRNTTGDYTINYQQGTESSRHPSVATAIGSAVVQVFGITQTSVRYRFLTPATGVLVDTDFSFISMGA